MPEPEPPPFDERAFDARAAELGLALSPDERRNALTVARFLHEAAQRLRTMADEQR